MRTWLRNAFVELILALGFSFFFFFVGDSAISAVEEKNLLPRGELGGRRFAQRRDLRQSKILQVWLDAFRGVEAPEGLEDLLHIDCPAGDEM